MLMRTHTETQQAVLGMTAQADRFAAQAGVQLPAFVGAQPARMYFATTVVMC